jgi:hypothetical protein
VCEANSAASTDTAKARGVIQRLSDSNADSVGDYGWRKNVLAEHVITNYLIKGPPSRSPALKQRRAKAQV